MADRSGYIGRAPGDSSIIVARQTHSPTGVQTDFTFASGYTVGYIDAYLNGSRLINAEDYTATDGTTVGLTSAANNGDILELVAYKAFNLANVAAATGNFSVGNNLTVTDNLTVSGDATSIVNITGTAGTFTDLTVTDQFTGNATGTAATFTTITATDQFSGNISGVAATFTGAVTIGGTLTYEDATNVDSVGLVTARTGVRVTAGGIVVTAGVSTLTTVNVSSGATFAGLVDINAELDVDGQTDLDNLVVAGVSTFSSAIDANGDLDVDGQTDLDNLVVAGVSTFSAAIDLNAELDVDGQTDLDTLQVAGVSTFSAAIDLNAELDVDGQTDLDNLVVSGVSTFSDNVSIGETCNAAGLVVKQSGNTFTTQSQTVALFQRSSTTGHGAKIAIVGGNAASSDINFGDTDDEDAALIQYAHTDNAFRFCTNGDISNEKLRIDSSGRVGINTDTFNDAREALRVQAPSGQTETFLTIKSPSTSGKSSLFFGDDDFNEGRIQYDHSDNSMQVFTNDGERLRVTSAGSVGVGTDAPTGILEVHGNDGLNVSNATRTGTNGAQWRLIPHNGGGSATNLRIYEGVGATEVINITKTGLIGINETNPGHYIDMNIGTTNVGIKISSTDAGAYIRFADNSTSGETRCGAVGDDFKIDVVGSERLRIDSNGTADFSSASAQRTATFAGNGIEINHASGSNVFIGTQSGSDGKMGTINNATMSLFTNNDYAKRVELQTDGDLSIVDGNLVVASGHGIDFSATGDSSGTNNGVLSGGEILDDYETGYWTPTVSSGSAPGSSLSISRGQYVKVGRQVTLSCSGSFTGGDNGNFRLTNLPYNADSTTTQGSGQNNSASAGIDAAGTLMMSNWNVHSVPNAAVYIYNNLMYFYYTPGSDGSTWTEFTGAEVGGNGGGGSFMITITYFATP